MSAFTRKAKYLTFGGIATLGLGIVAQLAVVPGASSVEGTEYSLHQGLPITNSGFKDNENDCSRTDLWGWHFVATGNGSFTSLTATFTNAGVITLTQFGPPDDSHAFVYTATDDTLVAAVATIMGGNDTTNFVLSHTCTPTTTPPTPTPTLTPSESVSPTETGTPTPTESVSPTETGTPTPTESVSPTETGTPTPTESVSPTETGTPTPTESVSPTETGTPTPTESVSPTETETTGTPTESVSPTETETTGTPTEGATVLPTGFTNSPGPDGAPSISPSVQGVKVTRPGVGPGALPNTGTPFSVALLLMLGVAMIVGGLVLTVAGEPRTAGGRYRR